MTDSFFKVHSEEVDFAGKKLRLETGHIARQADGAVLVTYGETTVLCTVVAAKKAEKTAGFFPLTVHYQEKAFAAGRIPSGFVKREGKPSEHETLTSRLIDRPIRPLFHPEFVNEVQIICTVLSHDKVNNPDIPAIIGTSAALAISGVPIMGTICAARVGYKNGEYMLNPSTDELKRSKLDLVVAGTKEGVLMVESEAQELGEDVMLGAVKFGYEHFVPVLEAIASLAKVAGKSRWQIPQVPETYEQIKKSVKQSIESELRAAFDIKEKLQRHDAISLCKDKLLENSNEEERSLASKAFEELEYELLRSDILCNNRRVDRRALDEVRSIFCEIGVLPRAHGSALFTRGETQTLVVTTLGAADDGQVVDGLTGDYKEGFLVHYNFPPYAVNEVGRMSSPGRREIGHGRLAWRALHPIAPKKDEFPYTIRIVSEVTESNGSSSMATVCGASLSMMDAGVPITKHISGIAMGLVKEGDKFAVLTDIQGDEDHLGDMDFKVAGTKDGITALQMDIKITSITFDIMKVALEQAHRGREHIAQQMAAAIAHTRTDLNKFAPQIVGVQISKDKIRELIGPGGKVIREICETTGTKIDISEDGKVSVFGSDQALLAKAMGMINDIVGEPEIGQVYTGPVVKITDFGAFVNFFGSRDGLVHISEISDERVDRVEDVLKEGDIVKVVLLGVDLRTRKARLSIKAVGRSRRMDDYPSHRREDRDGRGGRNDHDGRDRRGR
jgi:polyribonucleotide nucleotidyltransferase